MACVSAASYAAEHAPEVQGPAYVLLDPIFVSVIEGTRVTKQIGLSLMLEVAEGHAKADVEAKRKLINDAFFQALYGVYNERGAANRKIDERFLKSRLLTIANRVMGDDGVKEVLIEQFFERGR